MSPTTIRTWWAAVAVLVAVAALTTVAPAPASASCGIQPRGAASAQSPSSSLAPDLPPPPASFDACSIRYAGPEWGIFGDAPSDPTWTACLDGSEAELTFPDGVDGVLPTPDGRLVWQDGSILRVGWPGREERVLLEYASGPLTLSADGATAYSARSVPSGDPDSRRDIGWWRVPLDGTPPTRVLPPFEMTPMVGVVGPGERAFARGQGAGFDTCCDRATRARFPRGVTRVIETGRPLGIDIRGVLYIRRGVVTRYHPWDGSYHPMRLTPEQDVSVLPGGDRLLIDVRGGDEGEYRLKDLRTGRSRRLPLAAGYWTYTDLSTTRYLVLQDYADGRWAILDLEEGWLGYLPGLAFGG